MYTSTKANLQSSHSRCSNKKKMFLEISKNPQESTCASLFLSKVVGLRFATLLIKTLTQVFSCEFCRIFRNTLFYRTPPNDFSWIFQQLIFPAFSQWADTFSKLTIQKQLSRRFPKIFENISDKHPRKSLFFFLLNLQSVF